MASTQHKPRQKDKVLWDCVTKVWPNWGYKASQGWGRLNWDLRMTGLWPWETGDMSLLPSLKKKQGDWESRLCTSAPGRGIPCLSFHIGTARLW